MKHNFKYYCKDYENIENYEKAKADNFKNWCCHHRRGIDISAEELQALNMYYRVSSDELIFLPVSEHISLHKKGKKGKKHSEETKKKMSEAQKGRTIWNKGKHISTEHRMNIGKNSTGRHWYNNGIINKFCYECPLGYELGMLKRK